MKMENSADTSRQSVLNLMQQKEALEVEIKEYGDILKSQNVSMDDPLVDEQDYPRADIDVYQIRHARSQIRRLQNDYKRLVDRIHKEIEDLHSATREPQVIQTVQPDQPTAFLVVSRITQGSPAYNAGLREGDRITGFGSLRAGNFSSMNDVASVVQYSTGRPIRITLMREAEGNGETHHVFSLVPQTWDGPGLIGCLLTPIENPER